MSDATAQDLARKTIAATLYQCWWMGYPFEGETGDMCGRDADRILTALASAGLVVVPREPTDEMLEASVERLSQIAQSAREEAVGRGWVGPASEPVEDIHAAIYRAMIAATLTQAGA